MFEIIHFEIILGWDPKPKPTTFWLRNSVYKLITLEAGYDFQEPCPFGVAASTRTSRRPVTSAGTGRWPPSAAGSGIALGAFTLMTLSELGIVDPPSFNYRFFSSSLFWRKFTSTTAVQIWRSVKNLSRIFDKLLSECLTNRDRKFTKMVRWEYKWVVFLNWSCARNCMLFSPSTASTYMWLFLLVPLTATVIERAEVPGVAHMRWYLWRESRDNTTEYPASENGPLTGKKRKDTKEIHFHRTVQTWALPPPEVPPQEKVSSRSPRTSEGNRLQSPTHRSRWNAQPSWERPFFI